MHRFLNNYSEPVNNSNTMYLTFCAINLATCAVWLLTVDFFTYFLSKASDVYLLPSIVYQPLCPCQLSFP